MSVSSVVLTVEEAAARLGVSPATARRWAASGRLAARKSGKQWLIDGSQLPRVRPRRRVSAKPVVDLEQALRHVQKSDLTEPWVPDILRHEDQLADSASVLAAAHARFDGVAPGPAVEVEVDKTSFFTRWAALLTLEDRVAYQGAVASFADRIEALTPDAVFSARLSSDARYFLKRGPTQWVAWRRYVLEQVNAGNEWMVKTDLTAYFDTIPHKMLIAEIEALNPDRTVLETLSEMLRTWSPVPGLGLPQGGNASRLLANLYLTPVDRAMIAAGWRYSRYLDDVRIVTSTKADAIAAIRHFQRECRALGLIVGAAKTELLHGDEARADLTREGDLAAADYFMNANASNLARKALKKILKRALRSDVRIDERRARFSLWRLARLREAGVMGQVLKRLEDLAPVATVIPPYLRPFISRKRVVDGLTAFLSEPQRSHSAYLVTWIFAAMLEHPDPVPPAWVHQAAVRVKDRNQPAYLRAIAAVVMIRGGRAADINWIRNDINREHDPTVLRGYAVGLHWVSELDRGTQRRLIARAPVLAATTKYLQGRSTIPSLVYPNTKLRVR